MSGKKLKILYDSTVLSYFSEKNGRRSGIYFVTYNFLKEFLNHPEVEVTLYCDYKRIWYMDNLMASDDMLQKFKLMDCKDISNPLISVLAHLNFKCRKNNGGDNIIKKAVRFISYRSFHIYDRIRRESPAFKKRIRDFDVYFSPYEVIPKEILNDKKIKRFLFLHDVIPLILDDFYGSMNSSRIWFRDLLNSINKNDYYFANSLSTKNDFVKYAPEIDPQKVNVTYLGANENFYQIKDADKINAVLEKYNIPAGKKYLFSLCTLEPRKNLVFAIKNFIEFIKKNNIDDFVFVLGGGHWKQFLPQLEKEITDLNDFQEKIIKIGYVDDEDLSALYSGAEMFVYPSLYEGFGMPVLEAMQCGCPVITSNNSSLPEVIADSGIQIDAKNGDELVSAFKKMYYNETFRNECSKKGLNRARIFSWKNCVDEILKVIESIN